MEIMVRLKNVYGADLVYPACEKSELLLGMTGQKSFSPHHVAKMKALGYVLNVLNETPAKL